MRDTAHLSEIEECMYSRCIDQYYSREKALPLDLGQCARLVRALTAAARKALAVVLPEFFTKEADGWHQKRCDEELAAYRERSESKRSASVRWSERNANAMRTHSEGNASHKPVANSHKPEPVTSSVASQPTPKVKTLPARSENPPTVAGSAETWEAYRSTYKERYQVDPVRNKSVNAHLAMLIAKLGSEESPKVARFYVWHNRGLYVSSKHATNLLLRDAEGLRTEWATDSPMTDTQARQTDRTAATGNVFKKLIDEAERGSH